MQSHWAAEHLQIIRTLMERSALYRRALAPVYTLLGVLGLVAGVVGWISNIEGTGAFAIYWMAVSVIAIAGAFMLVRRQALKSAEQLWSPPTRRIAQAVFPSLFIGSIFGLIAAAKFKDNDATISLSLVIVWTLLYGLALHAAGFFMPRGIRRFGWGFLLAGLVLIALFTLGWLPVEGLSPHWIMGGIFGGAHLACGIYLYFTEEGKNAA